MICNPFKFRFWPGFSSTHINQFQCDRKRRLSLTHSFTLLICTQTNKKIISDAYYFIATIEGTHTQKGADEMKTTEPNAGDDRVENV